MFVAKSFIEEDDGGSHPSYPRQQWKQEQEQEEQNVEEEPAESSFSADVHSLPTVADITGKREVPRKGSIAYGDEEDNDHNGLAESELGTRDGDSSLVLPRFKLSLVLFAALVIIIGLAAGLTQRSKSFVNEEYVHDARFHEVVDYLANWDVSLYGDLLDYDKPQYLAAHWIAHDDPQEIQVPVGKSLRTQDGYTFAARYVLALLYFALGGSTNQWFDDLNFLSGEHYCDWFQILRKEENNNDDQQMVPKGVGCNIVHYDENTNNHTSDIDTLFLDNNGLVGSLPACELQILTTLRVLNLEHNTLTGEIPAQLFLQLSSLEHLSLSHNALTGTLPQWINSYHEKVLQSIDLSHNFLVGEIPRDFKFITSLRGLALDHNMFQGEINHVFDDDNNEKNNVYATARSASKNKRNGIEGLELLYLNDNYFTGAIDDWFMKPLTNLQRLDLSSNSLHGSIPQHFFEFPKLQVLDLHNNENITHELPITIPENDILLYLSIHQNNIVGPIPKSIQNLKNLQYLDLSDNRFSSFIPNEEIGNLSSLRFLSLAKNNKFQRGPIPISFTRLTNLQELSLKETQRTGILSEDIFSHNGLPRILSLDLDNNILHGTIPTSIGTMRNLEIVLLSKNMLTGTVPNEFENLISLRVLLVDGNALDGNMDVFCNKPSDYFKPYLTADCGLADVEIECSCCFLCCTNEEPCNENNMLPNLNPTQQFSYDRALHKFDDRTSLYSNNEQSSEKHD